MCFSLKLLIITVCLFSVGFAQDLTREQKLQKIGEFRRQANTLEASLLLPDFNDLKQAEKEGFDVFRITPRENITQNTGFFLFIYK